MSIRLEFVAEALRGKRPIVAVCAAYGISEKTGQKWLARFRALGLPGLAERAHTPATCPHRTPAPQREALLACRRAHPTWGARKLRAACQAAAPALAWPAASTITTFLAEAGLLTPRRRRARPRLDPTGRGPVHATAPNQLWTLDYKGHFRTGDGQWCYPLTVVDAATRTLLACVAHPAPETTAAQRVLARCFRTYGLPQAILSDNGAPFGAAQAPRGLSRLSCWFTALGIHPYFTVPGHPEHNGRHERLHRTLKAEATRPPARTRRAQQARFDAFRTEYNTVRPHEALGQRPPASLYTPSALPYPRGGVPALTYPTHFLERRVTSAGLIWWHQQDIYVSQVFTGYTLGLDPVSPTYHDVYLADFLLGAVDFTALRFIPLTEALRSPINPV
ncbi:MAG: IS481 family transposase [Gemmatimonadaceae bacterium]